MNKNKLLQISKEFKILGEPKDIKECNIGHINKTYKVTVEDKNKQEKEYILQYVNTKVFPNLKELMLNIKKVTSFIKEKAQKEEGKDLSKITITMLETQKENLFDVYNRNWRMEEFINNTITFLSTEDTEILYEAGKAVGLFQRYLDGFNAKELYEIIPNFHYTPDRFKQFNDSLSSNQNLNEREDRFKLAKDSIDFLLDSKRASRINTITDKLENGSIPYRVTHNDTKLSNILFDADTNKSVCLIDLDTVMPGTIAYDFGEGIRTCISTAEEDEIDLSKVKIDINRFKAFTKGFLENVKSIITEEELKLLPLGAWMMTYENALRFVTDYLNGDIYFSVSDEIENHNLVRARVQIELLRQMEEKEEEMKGMIRKYGL